MAVTRWQCKAVYACSIKAISMSIHSPLTVSYKSVQKMRTMLMIWMWHCELNACSEPRQNLGACLTFQTCIGMSNEVPGFSMHRGVCR